MIDSRAAWQVRERLREFGDDIRVADAAVATFLQSNQLVRIGDAVHVESHLYGATGIAEAVRLWLGSPEGQRFLPEPDRRYRRLSRPARLELVEPDHYRLGAGGCPPTQFIREAAVASLRILPALLHVIVDRRAYSIARISFRGSVAGVEKLLSMAPAGLAVLSTASLLLSVVHELGFFLVLGIDLIRLMTIADYLTALILWLPFAAVSFAFVLPIAFQQVMSQKPKIKPAKGKTAVGIVVVIIGLEMVLFTYAHPLAYAAKSMMMLPP